MIDKICIYQHDYLEAPKSLKAFPVNFTFKDTLDVEINSSLDKYPDFGTILSIEVKLNITLTNDFYWYHNKTEFILIGSPDFTTDHDKQLLAEMCVIAYHQTGQSFNRLRATEPWNKEKLDLVSVHQMLGWISSGKIPLPS